MLANLGSPSDIRTMGETAGRWIASDAEAAGGHKTILIFNMPTFEVTGDIDRW